MTKKKLKGKVNKSKKKTKRAVLERIKLNAAGIDIGSEYIYVAVLGFDVKCFGTFTKDIKALIIYLISCGVDSVAMETTGIYWFPIYDMLVEAGIEVYVVNAAHAKNVPGRKTDVLDSEWLRELHTFGLLRSSFIPVEEIRRLRTYMRLRDDHIEMAATHKNHLNKNLDAMNLKIGNVISDITGVSGQALIKAIISGERNSENLLLVCNTQIVSNKKEELLASFEGNYKAEYIFGLKQAFDLWLFYQDKIKELDKETESLLKKITKDKPIPASLNKPKEIRHHKPEIKDLHLLLMMLTGGKDAGQIAGINDYTLLRLVSETGTDMSNWNSEKHFTSWMGLAPGSNSSGKTKKRSRRRPVNNAGQIFRVIARNVGNSKYLALAGFYRRIKSRSGGAVANKATARKIAVLYYNLMTHGLDYVEQGLERYEEIYKQQMIRNLEKRAAKMGLQLVPAA